jgi:hypothetical protein
VSNRRSKKLRIIIKMQISNWCRIITPLKSCWISDYHKGIHQQISHNSSNPTYILRKYVNNQTYIL